MNQTTEPQFPDDPRPATGTAQNSGSQTAFTAAFLSHQRRIYRYILSLLPRVQDAEDVLQETAIFLFEHSHELTEQSNFVAWAHRVAYFKVLEFRRRQGRAAAQLDDEVVDQLATLSAHSADEFDIQRSAMEHCLGRLSDRDRGLLASRYTPGVTGRQVAAELGRPANSVYKSLGRIRRQLQECIRRTLLASEHRGGPL